jgi:hypothetical protein
VGTACGSSRQSSHAGLGCRRTGRGKTEEARQTQKKLVEKMALDGVFFFNLPLHDTTCFNSLPVCGGPSAHLLGGPIYTKQHLIFHQGPKTMQ